MYLEQLTCQSARHGSQLHRIQKTTENIHVSDGLRRIVTFLIIAPYKYSYLLTYLLMSGQFLHAPAGLVFTLNLISCRSTLPF